MLHLLARGEDPRRIRVLDIRRPIRKDLLEGAATEVDFVQVDVSDTQAIQAAFDKPWPPAKSDVAGEPDPEITVFHTAATIRFFERDPSLLHLSEKVNLSGTQNVLDASRRVGASAFVYTSSGSISVHSSRFFLWPWETEPKQFTQVVNDDDTLIPKRHEDFFSNYAVSKCHAERTVRTADRSRSGNGVLRTGCIRPGNGIYGPGGDLLVGSYLVRKTNPTWIPNILQSFIYVENCSLAHLCYEARLIERQNGGKNPDVGGQAFCVADGGPPTTYGDVYDALTQLSNGACAFPKLSCTTMLGIAHLVEGYDRLWHSLARSPLASFAKPLPRVGGDIIFLQPSMFALTVIHLIFDDSRARSPPEKGGLGYNGNITTIEGVCKVALEHQRGDGKGWERVVAGHKDEGHGFGLARAEKGVEEVIEKLANGVGVEPKTILS